MMPYIPLTICHNVYNYECLSVFSLKESSLLKKKNRNRSHNNAVMVILVDERRLVHQLTSPTAIIPRGSRIQV